MTPDRSTAQAPPDEADAPPAGLRPVAIRRVTPMGAAPTYNLTMRAPHHNYFVNDILTANSHAVGYSVIAYRTAYLKAHYPAHFWAAVLTNEVADAEKTARYVAAARRQGIDVLPPDVNRSDAGFNVENGKIRYGLTGVKGLGDAAVEAIIGARRREGPFRSLTDLVARCDPKAVTRRTLDILIKCGALDTLPGRRAQKAAVLEQTILNAARRRRSVAAGQGDLFGDPAEAEPETTWPETPEWSDEQRLAGERETLGFYLTGHPLAAFGQLLHECGAKPANRLSADQTGADVAMGGVVNNLTVKRTKKGETFAVFSLEDETGRANVVVWPETFRRCGRQLRDGAALLVGGRLELEDDARPRIVAETLHPLAELQQTTHGILTVYFPKHEPDATDVARLFDMLDRCPGPHPATLVVPLPSGAEAVLRTRRGVSVEPVETLRAAFPDWRFERRRTGWNPARKTTDKVKRPANADNIGNQ